ncbi:IgG-binding protein SBI [Staphylococcus schleiferi subsp. coagulans]|uniref:B domain-containing protein n=1 Tax=Staphylococcus coagulans TaxID=74706 RepID=UPI0015F79E31|nr:B domain-containing protein [Staphylococcus coagulans]MBA8759885.1 IgG-binding protein SBI [Staphylococcus coagulans]MBA8768676.1 IgG-binding protein SBI [Staphylococcus coagulans]
MKNKYIAKLLMGVATVSIATIVSNGQADASEQVQENSKTTLPPQTFESAKVSPEQKAFYQVLHMEGITEEQRDQYLKQLHEDKESAQNVFSESIKDSQRPERRVGQQNAFYEILNNEDITDEQRDRYISQIKEDPDASQKVFDESVNQTETKPAEPQIEPKDWEKQWQNNEIDSELAQIERRKVRDSVEAIQALEKKDSIENRRIAQRAVNKLMGAEHDGIRSRLQNVIDSYDKKIKEDAEARKIAEEKQQPQTEAKPEAPKAEKQPEAKKPEVKTEEKKPEVQKPHVQNQDQSQNQATPSQPSAPAVPKADVVPSQPSTWTDYWNSFKRPFEDGYTYIKDSFNNAKNYITESYNSITNKYNDAKYYSNLYFKYKGPIDRIILALFNNDKTSAYIEPIKIQKDSNVLYKSYAHTRNFFTETANTGKVLYTLYQNPDTVKTAIKTVEKANSVKNFFSNVFSIFKK